MKALPRNTSVMAILPPLAQAFSNPETGMKYRREFHMLSQECEQGNAVLPLGVLMQKYHDLYVVAMGGRPLSQNVDVHLVGNAGYLVLHVRFRIFAVHDGIWVTAECPTDPNGRESIPEHLSEYKAPKTKTARR